MRIFARLLLPAASCVLLLATAASGSTITLSDFSNNETPASVLDATFDFSISGPTELTLRVTNTTVAPDTYNINEIFFNADTNVSGLSLDSATHSAEGLVTLSWAPVDIDSMIGGFGTFDFGLTNGVGETDPSLIGPTEFIDFVFTISGTGPFADTDFATPNADGFTAAAKFVNGPGDNSAFGAVPEPGAGLLLGLGLVALAARRRS
jgi:hypothetical protein